MYPTSVEMVSELERLTASGTDFLFAVATTIGGTQLGEGVWRFYSESWPEGGIYGWNSEDSKWRSHWNRFLPSGCVSFGEDVFGNQLLFGGDNVTLWNHENGELSDLFVDPCELLRTVLSSGLGWIDFYSDETLSLAYQVGLPSSGMHLHWITPLMLGGSVARENLVPIDRDAHLIGHAKLWLQISA